MSASMVKLPRCANCDVEIPWRPFAAAGRAYCCGGCARGGPCYCSYDLPLEVPEDWRTPLFEGSTGTTGMGQAGPRQRRVAR